MRIPKILIISLSIILLAGVRACAKPQGSTTDQVMVILGDSNIWLAGTLCDNPQGWMAWLRDMWKPASCYSYARSGASWSHTDRTKHNPADSTAILADDNVIYNQVVRLRQAVDAGVQKVPTIILISSGGNDAWFAHRRPREFNISVDDAFASDADALLKMQPAQVQSLAGAIRYDCLQLMRDFPDAQIVLITPSQMSKVEPEMLTRVSDIIQQSADRLGLPTVRLDNDGPIRRDDEMKQHVNTYDGIHTSKQGAQRVAQYVSENLKSKLNLK